jgi:uncharacterized protein
MQTINYNDPEIMEAVIRKCDTCFIGVADENNIPYVLPMNFGYINSIIYLHSAQHGRVVDILKKNPNICVTFCTGTKLAYQNLEVACSYRVKAQSVVAFGKVRFIDNNDLEAKRDVLNAIMKQYSDMQFKYSDPAVRNVLIWEVPVDQMTCKDFGAPHDQYKIQRRIEELKNSSKQP